MAFPSAPLLASPDDSPTAAEFHLHPHYRSQRPLDALLLKSQAGLDDFITEKYAGQIAAILNDWSSGLLRSPQSVQTLEKILAPGFAGSSMRATETRVARSGGGLEVQRIKFALPTLGPDEFLKELQSTFDSFSQITTADFQITSIDAGPEPVASHRPARIKNGLRYEIAGSGRGFHREQRVGTWELDWDLSSPSVSEDKFRLRTWRAIDETRSHSAFPFFADITAAALASNESYSTQLLHGADYWRTVLDGACGIDVYGHNGVSVADIDNDGFDDLYVCQAAGLPNRLYRNCGDGTFEDITESSGLGLLDNTACALFADFNNNGRQDVIVVRATGPLLFLNQGGGKFRQQPDAFHFANPPQGTFTGAAVADYDRDGWLDIYFCLYIYYQGAEQYKYPTPYYAAENGPPNFMMRNNRDGTFRDVTAEAGLNRNNTRYSFCCGWGDYNRNSWPDLYVVNDFGRKNLYRNNGDGTFTDVAAQAGVEDIGAGMGMCWLDYDNDGAEDLYVADMWTAAGGRVSSQETFKHNSPVEIRALYSKHTMGNSLFKNKADAFRDVTAAAGVGMGRWAWSSDTFDFDHDGFPDLYIANGMISGTSRNDLNSFFWRQVVANSPDNATPSHAYEQGWNAINELVRADTTWSGFERNVFYANNRDGTFSDVSGTLGLDFLEDGRAFALADFDQDGRQEIFLKNRNAPQLRLLKNVVEQLPPSITFRLRGTRSNRDAIGAAVTVETQSGRQTRRLQAGSGFLSQHSKELFFGLGEARGPVLATIQWPSGLVQKLNDLPLNHRIWVEEGSSAPPRKEPFKNIEKRSAQPGALETPAIESLPDKVETWLLAPIAAPDFSLLDLAGQARTLASLRGKPALLVFWNAASPEGRQLLESLEREWLRWSAKGLQLVAMNGDDGSATKDFDALMRARRFSFPVLRASEDMAAVYNILYRYLFDRHRDLPLPTCFLLNDRGEIVKVYQGSLDLSHAEHDFQNIPETGADRLSRALPFPGVAATFEYERNYLSYGSIFFQRGYYDQAATAFQHAANDDPETAEALYGLGSSYLNLQRNAEAQKSFERAVTLRASYPGTLPNAWNNLGLMAAREGHTDQAIRYFLEGLKLDPDHLIALVNLGNAYRQQRDWSQARETFAHALRVNPEDPEANYNLGLVFAQTDDTAHAYEYLRNALKYRPDYPEALNNLGVLYLRTQRRDDAVASFEQCIRVAPAFDRAYMNLAKVYALEGNPEKARAVLRDLLQQHPDNAQAQKALEQLPK